MNKDKFEQYRILATMPKKNHKVEIDSHDLLILLEGFETNAEDLGLQIKASLAVPELRDKLGKVSVLAQQMVDYINLMNENIDSIEVETDFPEEDLGDIPTTDIN